MQTASSAEGMWRDGMPEYTTSRVIGPPVRSGFLQRVAATVGRSRWWCFASMLPAVLAAQTPSAAAAIVMSRGVSYQHLSDPTGPWQLHVVRIDLRRQDVAFKHVHARDALRGRERTSSIAQRVSESGTSVLAAINADFFDLKSGENENNQVIGGEWWKGLKVTDSPFDTYDNVHVQLAIDAVGRPQIDRFILDGTAWIRGTSVPVLSVNAKTSGTYEGTAMYTARYGLRTPGGAAVTGTPRSADADAPRDTTVPYLEVPLVAAGRHGDTLLYIRRGALALTPGSAIPTDGAVLTAFGPRVAVLRQLVDEDTLRIVLTTLPRLARGAPQLLIGGWPRLLQDGVNIAANAATSEGTISRNAEARHPRTAVGYSRDRKTMWLVVVDGRSVASVGMTAVELAAALKKLGAWDAMNFDGGGSTTMVVNGKVVNTPTDPTGEREVGNALLVVKRR